MDLEQNDRMGEWLLIVGDSFRSTGRRWFYALAVILVISFPAFFLVKFMFEQALIGTVNPITINYQETTKLPLEITERKIFNLGNGTYSGYARIKNSNSEWGVSNQAYSAQFKTLGGTDVMSINNTTFILPFSEKIVFFPRFSSPNEPKTLDIALHNTQFVRPTALPNIDLEIQRKSLDSQVDQTEVNAVIVNRSPFKLSRVDLPVLLLDSKNQVVGVNYTNINDLASSESRSFQYVWYNRINNVSRIEIIPQINIYDRNIFVTGQGANPFDERE
jgi:hypothetical protein